jgi:hypothetical protein
MHGPAPARSERMKEKLRSFALSLGVDDDDVFI